MFVLEPGAVVAGRYRLEHPLGEGGMGVVWAATHSVTRRRVALKFLKERDADASRRRAFVREARAACAVSHDGILPIHDVIESDDGEPALVMDLLKGEPLSARLAREPSLGLTATADIMLPVLAAVGAAHAAGVVHRDLKPDNIFLSDGGARILDFGLAKSTLIDAGLARSLGSQSGEIVGTPRYMSPEQAFAERDVDYRADVWSLGMVLYQCLSGILPTASDSLGQILKVIVSGDIPPLSSVAPDVPPALASVVDRMLSRDRAARPAGLHEVASALAIAVGRQVPDIPPPRLRGGLVPPPESDPQRSDRESVQQAFESDSGERSRPRRSVVAWAMAGFVLVAMLTFALWREPEPEHRMAPAAPPAAASASHESVVPAQPSASVAAEPTPTAQELEPAAASASVASPGSAKVKRRGPRPSLSSVYDDASDLDF